MTETTRDVLLLTRSAALGDFLLEVLRTRRAGFSRVDRLEVDRRGPYTPGAYSLVVLDARMNPRGVLPFIHRVRSAKDAVPIVVLAGSKPLKPFPPGFEGLHLLRMPFRVTEFLSCLKGAGGGRATEASVDASSDPLIGSSPGMLELKSSIADAARCGSTVLITGESGVGKELTARAIHGRSERRSRNFVVFECSSTPPELLESTLFGHP